MPDRETNLRLHMHPLASYCWKVLLAFYESAVSFDSIQVNGRPKDVDSYVQLWPLAKMPLLQVGDEIVPETTIIIDYLHSNCPSAASLIPEDAGAAREVRLWDRIADLYIHTPMQKLVSDRLRPEGEGDVTGVREARATLDTAYSMLDERMKGREWLAGSSFSMADCAAMPPLFYLSAIHPYRTSYPALTAYFERLLLKPSVQRVIREAQPYFQYFPFADGLEPRFLTQSEE